MRIPQLINDADELNVKTKDDDDVMMGRKSPEDGGKPIGYGKRSIIRASIDWKEYVDHFEKVQKDQLVDTIAKNLLQTKSGVSSELVKHYADSGNKEGFIKSVTLQLMSTPEYQLC
jgi:hypothetical protein